MTTSRGIRHRWPAVCWLAAGALSLPTSLPTRAAGVQPASPTAGAGCVRVVVDRALGLRWRVEPQSEGRPSRMVRMGADDPVPVCPAPRGAMQGTAGQSEVRQSSEVSLRPRSRPVIQVGERIVVVQSGSAIQARFPAVAMAAAGAGESFPARLEVGTGGFGKLDGRVVRATAVAGGLARWDGETVETGAGETGAGW